MSRATLLLDHECLPFCRASSCIERCPSWGGLASSSSDFLQLCDLHQYSSLGYICCHNFFAKLFEAKGRLLGLQTPPSLLIPSSPCNAISVVVEAKHRVQQNLHITILDITISPCPHTNISLLGMWKLCNLGLDFVITQYNGWDLIMVILCLTMPGQRILANKICVRMSEFVL